MTMRNSETVSRMEYKEQKVEQSEEGICVTTVLEDALGSEILHILRYKMEIRPSGYLQGLEI